VTCEGFSSTFTKLQNFHNSPGWTLIMKISALLILQLLKMKKIKCLYILDQTSFEEDMSFLSFRNLWFVISYIHGTTNIVIKQQNSHKSTEWPLISYHEKSALIYLQLLKLEKIMSLYFFWVKHHLREIWDMTFAWLVIW
jgi:hypothetical protein